MKKCPYCAEEIQDEAIKCRYCHEFLDRPRAVPPPVPVYAPPKPSLPWYFRTGNIVIAFLCVGPLALPLVWFHPRLSLIWKTALSIVILATSWLLYVAMNWSVRSMMQYYKMMQDMFPN